MPQTHNASGTDTAVNVNHQQFQGPNVRALRGYEDEVTSGWVREMMVRTIKAYISHYNSGNSCEYTLEELDGGLYTLLQELPDGGHMECVRSRTIFDVGKYIDSL